VFFYITLKFRGFSFFQNTTFLKTFRKNGYFHESYVIYATHDSKQIITHIPSFFSFLFLFHFSLHKHHPPPLPAVAHNHHLLSLPWNTLLVIVRQPPSPLFYHDEALSPPAALAPSFSRCLHHPHSTLKEIMHTFSLSI
jgi:hypothetical protein